MVEGDKERLLKERYRASPGPLLAQLRQLQPWADGKLVKARQEPFCRPVFCPRSVSSQQRTRW